MNNTAALIIATSACAFLASTTSATTTPGAISVDQAIQIAALRKQGSIAPISPPNVIVRVHEIQIVDRTGTEWIISIDSATGKVLSMNLM